MADLSDHFNIHIAIRTIDALHDAPDTTNQFTIDDGFLVGYRQNVIYNTNRFVEQVCAGQHTHHQVLHGFKTGLVVNDLGVRDTAHGPGRYVVKLGCKLNVGDIDEHAFGCAAEEIAALQICRSRTRAIDHRRTGLDNLRKHDAGQKLRVLQNHRIHQTDRCGHAGQRRAQQMHHLIAAHILQQCLQWIPGIGQRTGGSDTDADAVMLIQCVITPHGNFHHIQLSPRLVPGCHKTVYGLIGMPQNLQHQVKVLAVLADIARFAGDHPDQFNTVLCLIDFLQIGMILKRARPAAAVQIMNIYRPGCRLDQGAFSHNRRALIVSGLPSKFLRSQLYAVFN